MILNIVNGRPKVGTITVTTTAGATVTCVQSPYSLSATATSGTATFTVPKSGTWTLTATKNSLTKSGTASISAYNGTASVSLPLEYYLFNNGTQSVAWTFDINCGVKDDHILFNGPTYGPHQAEAYTTSTVNLSNYTTLSVEYTSSTYDDPYAGTIWASDSKVLPSGTYKAQILNNKSNKTIATVDVSEITGSKYIVIHSVPFVWAGSYINVYRVYLT